jgi:queuine tRNA-ribosyltransferase/7-cyano-7-deazaguanine tRNA-ribosyltransferase
MFTPEESIKIQKKLGADIILAFDECAPHPSTEKYTREAMERTHRWGVRCLEYHNEILKPVRQAQGLSESRRQVQDDKVEQALFGIVQGGIYKELREESAKFISNLPFDGIAIGGVSVGESKAEMRDVLKWVYPHLPEEKPRHLLGIGEIDDIFDAVAWGIDTFDCVIPTRFGRYGILFVEPPEGNVQNKFRIDITRSIFAHNLEPLTPNCPCLVCKKYTRAYVHHLFKSEELLAYRLASYHNVHFLVNLTDKIRMSILNGTFKDLKKEWLDD